MAKPDNNPQKRWKAVQLDYDYILAQTGEKCTICISPRSVQMILSQMIMLRWPTRYFSYIDTPVDEDLINAWVSRAECELMGSCDDQQLPVMRRVDPVTGYIAQISYDAGGTWITDPNSPSLTATALPPPVTAGTTANKCDAASNGLQHIKDLVAKQGAELATDNNVFTIIGEVGLVLVELIFAPPAALVTIVGLLVAVTSAIMGLGATAFNDYWTSDVYDKILCALFCHMSDDGSFTPAEQISAINEMEANLPAGDQRDWLVQTLFSIGQIGLNNFCAYGESSDADCSSCGCGTCASKFVKWEGEGTGSVSYGTDETGDFVQIASIFDATEFGGWGMGLTTNNPDDCCGLIASTVVAGTITGGVWLWQECGHPIPTLIGGGVPFDHSGLAPNAEQPTNTIARNSSTEFTIKLYFA